MANNKHTNPFNCRRILPQHEQKLQHERVNKMWSGKNIAMYYYQDLGNVLLEGIQAKFVQKLAKRTRNFLILKFPETTKGGPFFKNER